MNNLRSFLVESMKTRDKAMWKLIDEINFADLVKIIKSYKDYEKVDDMIKDVLQKKLDAGELTIDELEDIASNIRGHATTLFNMGGSFWGRGDDGCWDIATAAVALGEENYKKCLADPSHLKSMKKVTKEYENFLYPFNEFLL